jgi:hypothetical protein
MIDIDLTSLYLVPVVCNIVRNQQAVGPLSYEKLSGMIRCIETQYRIQGFHGGRPEQEFQGTGLLGLVLSSPQKLIAYHKTSAVKTDSIRFSQPTHLVWGKRIERPQGCGENSGDRHTAEDSKSSLLPRGWQLFDYHFRWRVSQVRIFNSWPVSTALRRQAKVSRSKIDLTFVDLDGQAVRIPEKGKAFIGGFIDANGFDPNPEAA